jgi:hypothetical protein
MTPAVSLPHPRTLSVGSQHRWRDEVGGFHGPWWSFNDALAMANSQATRARYLPTQIPLLPRNPGGHIGGRVPSGGGGLAIAQDRLHLDLVGMLALVAAIEAAPEPTTAPQSRRGR